MLAICFVEKVDFDEIQLENEPFFKIFARATLALRSRFARASLAHRASRKIQVRRH
jgi:hypothetical protein